MVDLLLSEVREEIAREKAERFLIKYWKIIFAVLLLCIISGISYIWLQYHKKNKIYADASVFIEAMTQMQSRNTDFGLIVSKLENLSSKSSNYAMMAKLYLAWFYDGKKEVDKATSIYDSISNDESVDMTFRDFSKILSLNLKIRSKTIENKDAINELDQYIETNPIYVSSAQIIQASLLLKENMQDRAREVLDKLLTNPNVGYHTRQTAMFLSTNVHEQ
ncbi:hypothetical protein [Candidatus Lariskella endosymbiont of Epinotia ramella]|uniref:DUF2659 family protein n=1 Tax=Candidatus Lariskella endosymbiont of Epinotia ramella TaxID=3066224 RepID=UPI0030D53445